MKPVEGINPVVARSSSQVRPTAPGFRDMVNAQVNFSRHAEARMRERKINLSSEHLNQLSAAMDQAKTAGAKQAAIVMEPGIFIVAPDSHTVITTVAKNPNQSMQMISHVDALVLVGGTSSEGASSPRPIDGGQPTTPVHWSLINAME